MKPKPIHTAVMYPRPHPDPVVALFLLQQFGEQYFPGIKEAKLEFWNRVPPDKTPEQWEDEGYLLLDLGGGKFDHHRDEHVKNTRICATTLVAQYLEVGEKPELRKLIEYTRRDDLEGRGIVSKDSIDRAFGFSAIIMNLNRDYPDHPEYVVDVIMRIVRAHYHEEYRRKVVMPQEFEKLKEAGKASGFTVEAGNRKLKVVMVESDSPTIVGYLRSVGSIQADVVVQKQSSGHTNIITRQTEPRLELKGVIAALRTAEAGKKGIDLRDTTLEHLEKPNRLDGVEEWYYDIAANTIQNGGAASENIPPTNLSLDELKKVLGQTLQHAVPKTVPQHHKRSTRPRRHLKPKNN